MILLFQPGIDEMNQARQSLSSDFFSAIDCAFVLAFIIGMFGALRVYHNWNLGRQGIIEEISAWFFAILFIILAGVFLRAVFGL